MPETHGTRLRSEFHELYVTKKFNRNQNLSPNFNFPQSTFVRWRTMSGWTWMRLTWEKRSDDTNTQMPGMQLLIEYELECWRVWVRWTLGKAIGVPDSDWKSALRRVLSGQPAPLLQLAYWIIWSETGGNGGAIGRGRRRPVDGEGDMSSSNIIPSQPSSVLVWRHSALCASTSRLLHDRRAKLRKDTFYFLILRQTCRNSYRSPSVDRVTKTMEAMAEVKGE